MPETIHIGFGFKKDEDWEICRSKLRRIFRAEPYGNFMMIDGELGLVIQKLVEEFTQIEILKLPQPMGFGINIQIKKI